MARNKNGYLGGLNGTMGNLVAYQSNGMSYVRRRPEFKKDRILTDKQLLHQAKFKLAGAFYRSGKELLKSSFEKVPGLTARNASIANVMKNVIGTSPSTLFLDYSEVLVASGTLKKVKFPIASSTEAGKLHFEWTNLDASGSTIDDKAILVAYSKEMDEFWYTLAGPKRSALAAQLDVPFFSGKDVHTWVSFISPDGLRIADSEYAGEVSVV